MPVYPFMCASCGHTFTVVTSITLRDKPRACPGCGSMLTDRLPTNANFVVNGHNAKNGYSK